MDESPGHWLRTYPKVGHKLKLYDVEQLCAEADKLDALTARVKELEADALKWRRAVVGNSGPNHTYETIKDGEAAIGFADELRTLQCETVEGLTAEVAKLRHNCISTAEFKFDGKDMTELFQRDINGGNCECRLFRPCLPWPDSAGRWWWWRNPTDQGMTWVPRLHGGEGFCIRFGGAWRTKEEFAKMYGPARFCKLQEVSPFITTE